MLRAIMVTSHSWLKPDEPGTVYDYKLANRPVVGPDGAFKVDEHGQYVMTPMLVPVTRKRVRLYE